MKKLFFLFVAVVTLVACGPKKAEEAPRSSAPQKHPEFAYDAAIYELNTRQFTKQGTFAAAEAELLRLDELGYDIIWIMPIQPIGELKRKGELGSYYAIKDYCAFNPEFGTRKDFESFLDKAHSLGMKVILDWVANHTAPDHPWTQNEGWHMRDSLGNLVVNYDWYDIAELNYDNKDMRMAMADAMAWWMDSIGIDGFRCDVAHEVPTDFWEDTFEALRKKHPNMFTLCESENIDLTYSAFNMYYGWEFHHLMNGIAKGEKNVEDLWTYFKKVDMDFPDYSIRLNFTSNHDENSWAGTEFERMGPAAQVMAMLTYFVPGMPLTYTGQEVGNVRRLEFFDKDNIEPTLRFDDMVYRKGNAMRAENPAIFSNELGARLERVTLGKGLENVFAFRRAVEGNSVHAFFNFSNEQVTIYLSGLLPEGDAKDHMYIGVETHNMPNSFNINPWGAAVLCY